MSYEAFFVLSIQFAAVIFIINAIKSIENYIFYAKQVFLFIALYVIIIWILIILKLAMPIYCII